jgi:putative ABC transport system ATP-binding protein
MSIIKVENITKIYNETKVPVNALNGVSFEIQEGEFTAIVGPSGCGKTTLLNILGGLDYPTAGSVKIADTEITKMKDKDLIDFRLKNIGFVFQAYNLIPVLTTLENVEFIMLLQKVDKKKRIERSMSLLKEMGIADKAGKRPSELSGGAAAACGCSTGAGLKAKLHFGR